MAALREGHVVVAGGSMAGLFAARAISDQAASVVVLERERLTGAIALRGRVPQGRHLHSGPAPARPDRPFRLTSRLPLALGNDLRPAPE